MAIRIRSTNAGLLLFSQEVIRVPASVGLVVSGGTPPTWQTGATRWTLGTSAEWITYPIAGLLDYTRIQTWTVRANKTSAVGQIDAELYRVDPVTGAATQVGSTASNSANNPGNIPLTDSPNELVNGSTYFIRVRGSGTTGDEMGDALLTLARPYLEV